MRAAARPILFILLLAASFVILQLVYAATTTTIPPNPPPCFQDYCLSSTSQLHCPSSCPEIEPDPPCSGGRLYYCGTTTSSTSTTSISTTALSTVTTVGGGSSFSCPSSNNCAPNGVTPTCGSGCTLQAGSGSCSFGEVPWDCVQSSPTGSGTATCSNYCDGSYTPSGSACNSNAYIPQPTTCYVSESINTNYQQASNPLFNTPGSLSPFYQSPANIVDSYNTNNAPWLLTCPLNPYNPSNPIDARLFYTPAYNNGQYAFVAGDVCLANTQQLTTQVSLPVSIQWDTGTAAHATVKTLALDNAGSLQLNNLAYSPMLRVGLQNVIAASYDNSSYVFQSMPSMAQKGIWSWSATFADFNGMAPDTQTVNAMPLIQKQYDVPLTDNDLTDTLAGSSNDVPAQPNGLQLADASPTQTAGTGLSLAGPSCNAAGGFCIPTPQCHGICGGECYPAAPICSSSYDCGSGSVCCICQGATTVTTSTSTSSTSTTSTAPTTTIEQYTCQYSYKYSESTSLQSVSNVQIPFNEVIVSPTNQVSYNQFDTPILPYLLYNFSVPGNNGQYLNESYDIFSPWNYHTPSNSVDLFPIDTPDRFYISYNGYLVSSPLSGFSNMPSLQGLINGISTALQHVKDVGKLLGGNSGGQLGNPYISGPISIAAMPNDYVFVLNKSSANNHYYLSVLRLIPQGYYNSSTSQPDGVSSVSVDSSQQTQGASQFASNWNAYWAGVVAVQNQTTYLIDSVDLTNMLSSYYYTITGRGGGRIAFTPLNISVDDYGNVYVSGAFSGQNKPGLAKISGMLTGSPKASHADVSWSQDTNAGILPSIAATSTGGFVFLGGQSGSTSGTIYVFSGNDLSSTGTLDLSFNVTNSALVGQNVALNIPYYLENGGLYNYSIPGLSTQPGITATGPGKGGTFNPGTDFDRSQYHHVLGLQEVNGYLYVLDDWSASINSAGCASNFGLTSCPNANMNLLMVRVLNSTGSNVPLNPTLFNDLYQQQQCTVTGQTNLLNQCTVSLPKSSQVQCGPAGICSIQPTGVCGRNSAKYDCVASGTKSSIYYSTATALFSGTQTYPPYGWILAANVSVGQASPVNTNFCSSPACTFTPWNLPGTYKGNFKPTGPGVPSTYASFADPGFTINFNSTIDAIFKSVKVNTGWFGICIPYIYCPQADNPHYNELMLGTTLNVENYTKLFDGVGLPQTYCYTDSSSNSDPRGCSLLDGVKDMSAPVYTVTNPFRYLEGLGAAQQLTFAGEVSATLPPGIANQSCASIIVNGQQCTGTSYYNAGPPSLNIEQSPVGWGIGDQATVQSGTSNTVQVLIDGAVVASGVSSAAYTICSSPSACLSPGNHQVQGKDTGTGKTTTTTLKVNDVPLITLVPTIQVQGSQEYITANAFNAGDAVELLVDGAKESGPTVGGTSYSENTLTPGTYTITAKDTSNGQQSTALLYVVSNAIPSASGLPSAASESLTSQISGYAVVPYSYTYKITQTWSNPTPTNNGTKGNGIIKVKDSDDYGAIGSCPTGSVFSQQGSQSSSSLTVFSYSLVKGKSDTITATIEGGPTYLYDVFNNDYFVPNLTNTGLIIPPQIQYQLQNDRLYSSIYANSTLCSATGNGLDCSSNKQLVLNATNQSLYQVLTYQQTGPTGSGLMGGYQLFGTYPLIPQPYSPSIVHGTPASLTQNAAVFNYSSLFVPTSVPLFAIYRQVVYNSPLNLYLNGTTYKGTGAGLSLLGYQRLTYVFSDRFGNRIYAPIDADVAYPVTVKLNVQTHVSVDNANYTTINVIGQAGVYSNLGTSFTPLPPGNDIYLYYDTNLDFVNYNAKTDPVNAIYCAYGVNAPVTLDCTPSNPVLAGRGTNSNLVTYAPAYNSISGTCGPPPNGLLQKNTRACNVYGDLGLSASCPLTGGGSEQFCAPVYLNGTGFCTSQLGLMDVAKTGQDGSFAFNTVACGNRQDTITAQFYGYPGPEPVAVTQAPLSLSQNSIGSVQGALTTTNNINYQYAPSQAATSVFQIGLFLLSYNNISLLALLASIGTSLALLFARKRR